ncbi:MAG: enoyl-CoA hydratase/isomerase family protein [Planctomycetota bacterium]|jgi:cyclohexa-1,5-dienecarbonyl-CoA hydratase
MGYEHIRFSLDDKVARLTLARPPLNVLNIAMMREMNEALDGVVGNGGIRTLVISGEGKCFSSGVDVGEHMGDSVKEMIEVFHGIFRRMDRIEAPIVGVVHGATLGGGCELALLCDIILASDDLKIGQPEIQVGVFPPIAAVAFPTRMGWAAAADLVLSGRVVKAHEALAMGLVSRVFPSEEFSEKAEKAVRALGALSGPVLRSAKAALRAGARPPLGALPEVEKIYMNDLMTTHDAKEGLQAFLDKRKPVWKDE